MTAPDLLSTLARREQLLTQLREAPRAKSDLVADLDVSRSTVDRAVRKLEEAGLLERRDGVVALTLAGRLVFDEYRQFRERTDGVLAAREALAALPADTDVDPAALAGAEVTLADRTAPYRPAERQSALIERATRADLLGTAVAPRFVEAYRAAILDGTEVRAAVTPVVAESLVVDHAEALSEMLSTGRLALRVLDTTPPFSLTRFELEGDDERLALMIRSADGPRAHVQNDTDAAVSYAADYFERHWARADPLSPAEAG
ncbi:helix-turn-helix transcriptional regulator [Halosegnis sp.]|uniref:helix-turn-helix transcriptional regulator n=1 Tax=Halosegnis sp. TaxID=2864959 RepID=UPI0035D4CB07